MEDSCCNDSHDPPIEDGDKVHFDDHSKSEAFNTYFLKRSNIDTTNARLPDPIRYTNSLQALMTSIRIMPGDSTVNQLVQIYHLLCGALVKKKMSELYFVISVKFGSGMRVSSTN